MPTSRLRKTLTPQPKILIFDVDGVLVDVRESFWRSALETVRYLTGKRATWAELYRWKNKPGNNDDWNSIACAGRAQIWTTLFTMRETEHAQVLQS